LTKAETALNYAKDTEKIIKEKEQQADELIRSVSHAKTEAVEAYKKAKETFDKVEQTFNNTESMLDEGRGLITSLTNILSNNTASPAEIKEIAEGVLRLDLHLDPDEIKHLANDIDKTVAELENVETIIENTQHDLEMVEKLKMDAVEAQKRASDVLKRAMEVNKALEEAETAQNAARDAIKKANDDIASAKTDLEDINTDAESAKSNVDETAAAVDNLQTKLSKLQKKFIKNTHDAKEVKSQADVAKELSSVTHEKANKLKDQYKEANDKLNSKTQSTEYAREKAQQLLQRAFKITVDTNGKLKELKEMVNITSSNDAELSEMEQKILRLNGEIDAYIQRIRDHADRYRTCTS
jgi:coxsackievirus/adenovirus receptor